MSDTAYQRLPKTDAGWDEWDWMAVFGNGGNASDPEWFEAGPGGAPVPPITVEDIAEVEQIWTECNVDYADSQIAALLRLVDGRYATVVAWSDSSGWGCRDATVWRIAPDRSTAIKWGLDNEAREKLGLALDA